MTHCRLPRSSSILGTAVLAVFAAPTAAQSVLSQFGESVIASGMLAPGFPAGATFGTAVVFGPALDRNGTLLFKARITPNAGLGIDATNDGAYYLGHGAGDLQMVVRAGSQAPGCPAGTLLRNNTATPSNGLNGLPRISPLGEILFFRSGIYDPATPANTPTNADSALFWGPAGAIQLLAREGDLVPFLGNSERWGDMQFAHTTHHITANGAVTFQNALRIAAPVTSANDSLLVTGTPGNLQVVVREGSPWPGSSNGETVGPVPTFVQSNEAGMVLHAVSLAVGSGTVPVTAANDRALAIWFGGGDFVVAREGDQAPGLPAGVVFADVSPTVAFHGSSPASFNQGGSTIFRANLAGGGTTVGVDDTAVWVGGLSGVSKVFRRDEQAPNLPAGVRFGTVADDSLGIDDLGNIVCTTSLQGAVTAANDSAVWFGPPNNLVPIAREGAVVAALPASANGPWTFGDLAVTTRAMLNGSGQLILPVQVTDGVATKVVWLGFTPPGLVRVLIDGTETWSTNLGSSTTVTIGVVSNANGGDTSPSWFHANGDFGILATLPATPSNLGHVIVRGHLGTFQAVPAAVPASGGLPQNFTLDVGAGLGNQLYLVLATSLGTRPGFPSLLGPQNVPLNLDPLWTLLTINAANSPIWFNSLGLLDANGKGIGPAGFLMPTGFPGFLGTTLHHAALVIDGTLTSTFVTEPVALKFY